MTRNGSAATKEKGSERKGHFKGLLKGGAVGLLVVIVGIAVLWYLSRPQGQLRLAVDAGESDAKTIQGLFDAANQKVSDVIRFHNLLGLNVKEIKIDPVPPEPGPNDTRLIDLVTINNSSFKFDWRVIKFEGEFKLNQILLSLYYHLGWHDDYLVIRDYGACANSQTAQPAPSADCHSMAAHVWPLDPRGFSPNGTSTRISDDLAVYLFKTFLQAGISDRKIETASVVPPSDLSNSFDSLEATAGGLDILRWGMFHPTCLRSTMDACRTSALDLFQHAWSRDSDNKYALLGLGLLRLDEALTSARTGGRIFEVLDKLNEAGRTLGAARRSAFLADFLARPANLAQFRLVDLHALSVTPQFIQSITDYSRSYRAYVEADYPEQLNISKRVTEIPEELKPYLEAFEYEAKLDLAKSREEAEPLLKELGTIAATRNIWDLQIVYGTQACRFGFHDIADAALRNALDGARGNAVFLYDTYVWQAYCLAMNNQREEASRLVDKVASFLADPNKQPSERELQTIYIDLGYYFASIQDYDGAAKNFRHAMNGCLRARIVHDEQLRSFKSSVQFRELDEEFSKSPGASHACEV